MPRTKDQGPRTTPALALLLGLRLLLVLPLAAHSGVLRYVHGDSPCPGEGTEAAPYCRLVNGLAALQCGDTLRVRGTTQPYQELLVVTQPSCPQAAPILVEAWGHPSPVLLARGTSQAAVITLRDVSHWTLRGLEIVGHADGPRFGVLVQARERPVEGVALLGLHILGWNREAPREDAVAVLLMGNPATGARIVAPQLFGLEIHDFAGTGLRLSGVLWGRVEASTLGRGVCGPSRAEANRDVRVGQLTGIKLDAFGWDTPLAAYGTVLTHNRLRDFEDVAACQARLVVERSSVHGIYGDVGPSDVLVQHNVLERLAPQSRWSVYGIRVESRCDRWQVRGNTLRDIGGGALWVNGSNVGVTFAGNLVERPAQWCVVVQPGPEGRPARGRRVLGNTCRDPGTAAILVPLQAQQEEGLLLLDNSWQR